MTLLTSIDLFSGIGGITTALHSFAKPVLYCEIDAAAQAVLKHAMSRRLLPRAPIHSDIQNLTAPPRADIVVAGIPCVGWSNFGNKRGLDNEQSGLFYRVLDVIDRCGATCFLFENVPLIMKDVDVLERELCKKRKFVMRYTCVSASDVGAPHQRTRWYCLGYVPGSPITRMSVGGLGGGYKPYPWKHEAVPRTTTTPCTASLQLLGNSVVPDAVRLAFLRLLDSSVDRLSARKTSWKPLVGACKTPLLLSASVCEVSTSLQHAWYPSPIVKCETDLKLVIDPAAIAPPAHTLAKLPALQSKVRMQRWSTPRRSCPGHVNVLTRRTVYDLASQVRFEKGTKNRKRLLNPEFVEWMMGFPAGFTAAACTVQTR